jgi:oligosaccharide repeat unit polymerase
LLFGKITLGKFKQKINYIILMPLVSSVLWTFSMGGRHGIIDSFFLFMIGSIYAYSNITIANFNKDFRVAISKKMKYFVPIIIAFLFYSTYVNNIRSEFSEGYKKNKLENYLLLKPVSGVIIYLTDHYLGYQSRRIDSYTEQVEFGKNTLQGFTKFELPFVSQAINYPLSIEGILNVFNLELWESEYLYVDEKNVMFINATTTIFFPIIDDYGFYGALLFITLLVLVSQYAYNKIVNNSYRSILPFLFYSLIMSLWFNSIFGSQIKGNWLSTPVFVFIIFTVVFEKKLKI